MSALRTRSARDSAVIALCVILTSPVSTGRCYQFGVARKRVSCAMYVWIGLIKVLLHDCICLTVVVRESYV